MRKTVGLSHIKSDTAKLNKSSRAGVPKMLDSSSICNPCQDECRGYFLGTLTEPELDYRPRFDDLSSDLPNAATRNVDLIAHELKLFGHITPELRAMVLDEELTHAAEVIAAQEMGYAAIPRTYCQTGGDLIDAHNQSLKKVFADGINSSRQELSQGVPGADWELRRRKAEFKNLETILAMPDRTVCVEISAPPFDKPESEKQAQHYNDLTMIRVSIKDRRVLQYNYALPLSSLEFLQTVQTKLGRSAKDHLVTSEELLENPIVERIDQPAELAAQKYDSLIGAAVLEVSVGHSAVRMIKKAVENRRETWKFVSDQDHSDIHQELVTAMQQAAFLNPAHREQAMSAIRSGFWKEFKDRFRGNQHDTMAGDILRSAAARAVADADVFIACGSTVVATEFSTASTRISTVSTRAQEVEPLRNQLKGEGSCGACGMKGSLFGCGLCRNCNKKWCDQYVQTGKQLEIKNLAYLNYGRPSKPHESAEEIFVKAWQRIGHELQQKQRKLQEQEAKSSKAKVSLAESA